MRLTQAVRIGGQLALLIGFAFLNLANGDSLSYFYGYSSPNLAAWQSNDALGSQNVRFMPQVPLVSQQSGSMDVFGSSWGNSNAYSAFGNSSAYTPAPVQSTMGAGWQTFSMGPNYSALNTYGAATNFVASTGSASSLSNYNNVNGANSWNAWTGSGSAAAAAPSFSTNGWAPVSFATIPPVSGNFTSPTWTPAILPPSVNTNFNDPFSAPEPATIGFMAAGLAGLFWLRRRRA